MKCDIPLYTRCCFCFPLRQGLIAWAYFKMTGVLAILGFLITIDTILHHHYGTAECVLVSLVTVLMVFDVVFNVILLVAAHKKNSQLMELCLHYNIFLFVASNIDMFCIIGFTDIVITEHDGTTVVNGIVLLMTLIILILNGVIQLYIIILIRSEVVKLNNCVTVTNDADNSYCYMKANFNDEGVMKDLRIMKQHATILQEPTCCHACGVATNNSSVDPPAHKNERLMKSWLYYQIFIFVVTNLAFVLYFIYMLFIMFTACLFLGEIWLVLSLTVGFMNAVLQFYLILLIRSLVHKLSNDCSFQFENNAVAAQCHMNTVNYEKFNINVAPKKQDKLELIKEEYPPSKV